MTSNTLADYLNTVIYEIKCKDEKIIDTYIGHTTCFSQRYRMHKNSCINPNQPNHNCKIYQNIRANGGWENWEMVGIEQFPCNNVNEAREREAYWIQLLSSSLNIKIPGRKTTKEYRKIYRILHKEEMAEKAKVYRKINCDKIKNYIQKHLGKIKDQQKEWYEKNKEKILEKAKENYEVNKEEKLKYQKEYAGKNQEKIKDYLKEYNEKNKEQISANQKVYRQENKEEIASIQKKWREIHQTELKEKKGQIIHCECGSEYTFGNQDRHFHSKKHLLYENQGITEEKEIIIEKKEEILEKPKQEKNIVTLLRISNAQSASHCSVINAHKVGVLNVQRCKSKESRNKYNEIHKEEIKKQCKKYYEENKNKILEQTKIYVEENKEKIKNYKDDWYQKNKEKILANQKETFACECGSNVRCAGRAEHLRSVKHKNFITSL
jgi:hypothetical protein